jgi:hypothetical protein
LNVNQRVVSSGLRDKCVIVTSSVGPAVAGSLPVVINLPIESMHAIGRVRRAASTKTWCENVEGGI